MSCTNKDTPSPISDVLTQKKLIMCCERYMKESTVTTQEQDLWQKRHLEQATTSQHYKRMHMTSLRYAISANASRMSKCDQGN